MASVEMRIQIRYQRPWMWRTIGLLRPILNALPDRWTYPLCFFLLGSQYTVNNGKTWRDIRCP